MFSLGFALCRKIETLYTPELGYAIFHRGHLDQKEVFRVQILRPADIFLTFPWGYIGVLGLYGTRATSALTSIRQNLIFFSLKGRYGQKGEIRIP